MRKILVATPLKGEIPPEYMRTLIALLGAKLPDTKFIYAFLGGCTVQWARDELVQTAIRNGCTEVLFWDKDLEPTLEHGLRLLSHDVDVVCGLYSKRHLNTHWHVHGDPSSKESRADGLMKVLKVAIGFSKIKISVFAKLARHYPERVYWKHDGGEEPVTLHEFFPMGIVGPNSYRGKLERIRTAARGDDAGSALTVISTNQIRGEDFYFRELCEEAGIPLYLDPNLIIPHDGNIRFPIPTPQLLAMINEPWRADELRSLNEAKPVEDAVIPS